MSSSEINDIDNPKHKYYLKVCYICKETTTKEHCIHYGALACFSCRAFFRRSHQSMQDKGLGPDGKRKLPEFICKKSGKCNVTPKTRRRCQKCRYDLCIKAGMQPEAVMTEDQVKVRFRKMFTKRGENKNSTSEENTDINQKDNETYQHENCVELERRKSLDTTGHQQQPYGINSEVFESRMGQNVPIKRNSQPMPSSAPYHYNRTLEEDQRSYYSHVNREEETSYRHQNISSEIRDGSVCSTVFDSGTKVFAANETSSPLQEEKEDYNNYQNFSKKQRILESINSEYPNNVQSNPPSLNKSWDSNQTFIKQEITESPEADIDFFSLSDEEKTTPIEPHEPQIEMIEFDEVKKELESPESNFALNDVTSSGKTILNENSETPKNEGETFDTDDDFYKEFENENVRENFVPDNCTDESISNDEDTTYLKREDDPSSTLDTTANQVDDFEKSIDFNKIIGPNIQEPKQRTPSPPVFKSPSLPTLNVKRLRIKRKSRNNYDSNIKTENKHQNPDETDLKVNKYNRLRKRIADVEASYRIACSQIYYPDNIVNKLINFHLGCSTAQKEDFLSCANSLVSTITMFLIS